MIKFTHKGNFNKTTKFLNNVNISKYLHIFDKYGKQGVDVLSSSTPKDSGETGISWDYKIKRTTRGVTLTWTNSNVVDGVPIAIILQYGHATRNGGYVQGRDYINPAIQPIFDKITTDIWKEVTEL